MLCVVIMFNSHNALSFDVPGLQTATKWFHFATENQGLEPLIFTMCDQLLVHVQPANWTFSLFFFMLKNE